MAAGLGGDRRQHRRHGEALAAEPHDPGCASSVAQRNGGKGAAVLDGLRAAAAEGFTHVLVMDADGQHPAAAIPDFMALSRRIRRR